MRRAEALAEFAALADLGPLDFDQALLWCQIRCSTWDPEKVVPQLRELLGADPDDRGVRLTLAEGCRRLGRPAEALEVLAALGESDPDALAIRARLAIERGDLAAAAAMLSRGPADHPELAELRGQLALIRRDGPAAVDRFRRAVADQPDRSPPPRRAGPGPAAIGPGRRRPSRLLARVRRQDVLIDRVRRAAEMTHRDDLGRSRDLGAACEALGLSAEARAWYDLALARDPLDPETQGALHRLRTPRPTAAPRVIPSGEVCALGTDRRGVDWAGPGVVQGSPHPFQRRPHRRVAGEVVPLLGVLGASGTALRDRPPSRRM